MLQVASPAYPTAAFGPKRLKREAGSESPEHQHGVQIGKNGIDVALLDVTCRNTGCEDNSLAVAARAMAPVGLLNTLNGKMCSKKQWRLSRKSQPSQTTLCT